MALSSELQSALGSAQAVRFICSGNMVRSAYAELYARDLGCALPVDSVGTTYRNYGLYPKTRSALASEGVPEQELEEFRSRHLDDIDEAPAPGRVAFGMTPAHVRDYQRARPGEPVFLLRELLGDRNSIADPVLDPIPFEVAFDAVRRCVRVLVDELGS